MMNNTLIILSTISVDLNSGLVRQWKRKYFFDTCNCSTTKIQKSTAKSLSKCFLHRQQISKLLSSPPTPPPPKFPYFRNHLEHSEHFT